jgi:membrane associated rhomboid family serine protease
MGAALVLEARKIWVFGGSAMGLVLLNLAITFVIPGISIGGHIGGLLAGAAAGAVLQPVRWPQEGAALRTTVVVGLGATFLVAGVAAATTFTMTPLF